MSGRKRELGFTQKDLRIAQNLGWKKGEIKFGKAEAVTKRNDSVSKVKKRGAGSIEGSSRMEVNSPQEKEPVC
ncbi:hypothetical protein V6N13_122464 [Hibiscus sabdariffa]